MRCSRDASTIERLLNKNVALSMQTREFRNKTGSVATAQLISGIQIMSLPDAAGQRPIALSQ
jgi:hypothetical protein